ncbi:GNAT family N-acetyltransferase [Tsukamurella soli]|uniref:GNAT family N-acetyltransferase n=1 Tax=Tsukamurella soli TaxID=644556 RepID=A0ABP8JW19_9ACTN
MTTVTSHVLDDPVTASLHGAHSRFRVGTGAVVRYSPPVARFVGFPRRPTAAQWDALAALAEPGEELALRGLETTVPAGWRVRGSIGLVQFDGTGLAVGFGRSEVRAEAATRASGPVGFGRSEVRAEAATRASGPVGFGRSEVRAEAATRASEPARDPGVVVLGPCDVPSILDLVARTRPGPFTPRTIELGTYLGIHDGDRLVAVAGERLHPPGWTEISAVCTDPAYRGRGLATRLIRAVGAGIRDRGEVPFLHTAATNTRAIALYEHLGFTLRSRLDLTFVAPPATASVAPSVAGTGEVR